MSIHHTLAIALLVVGSAFAAPAVAQPLPTATPAAEGSTGWSARYSEARASMLAGNFGTAAAKFAALLDSAPDSASRFLAVEMMSACRIWPRGDSFSPRRRGWR